jgi:hypothetical protein
MQLDPAVALQRELSGWNLQLRVNLVNDRACASRALVIHRRDFLLAPGFVIVLEDDDLGVLPAQLDD